MSNLIKACQKPLIPKLARDFWRFESNAVGLRSGLKTIDNAVAIVRTSKTLVPTRVSTSQVFGDSLVVFLLETFADLAVLSSAPHVLWAAKRGSGLRKDPRYTPSTIFATFPRPNWTQWLQEIGKSLHEERREIMIRRNLGLTRLYNLVNDSEYGDHDPDVNRMREIHTELDKAVMDAYGWTDIELNHGFHTYRKMTRWAVCDEARVEILDRLLEENHRRAALEAESQPSSKKKSAATTNDVLF